MVVLAYEPRTSVNPLWWRIPVWAALTAVTIASAHGHPAHQIAGGVIMVLGVVAIQFLGRGSRPVRQVLTYFGVACGLAATVLMPGGVAEVLALIPTGRAPRALSGRALIVFIVLDTLAFATVVGIIAKSIAGALAGTAIPFIVQREIDHQALIRERDRAQALLAEVQAGREAATQAAALRERGRIAREMHDVLAHSLAGLSVQLQAVRAIAAKERVGATVLDPLDKAATLAREGLAEARAAVSTLRDPVGLGLAELPALVERHPGDAALSVTGEPGAVRPAAGHAVYRAIQEALTNAARYAPGSPVAVHLVWAPSRLTATVRDTGPAPERVAVPGQGTGLGLAGMQERLAAVGGTVHSGPHPAGGWQVEVRVPTEEADVRVPTKGQR